MTVLVLVPVVALLSALMRTAAPAPVPSASAALVRRMEHPQLTSLQMPSGAPSAYRAAEVSRRAAVARSRPYQVGAAAQLQLSYLEATSVTESTLRDYRQRLTDLYKWAWSEQISWSTVSELDEALVRLFDAWFWDGMPVDHGG